MKKLQISNLPTPPKQLWLRRSGKPQTSEYGMASIIVVFSLVILFSLVSISFTKLMDRNLQRVVSDQSATAADYAALSAINDVTTYLKNNPTDNTNYSKCAGPGSLLDKSEFQQFIGSSNLSPDTKYTCILVDPSAPSLSYQGLKPYKSKVVKTKTNPQPLKLLVSWQSPNRAHNLLVSSGNILYDEKTWAQSKYAPLLRVSLYLVPTLVPTGSIVGNAENSARTYFLYPRSGGSGNVTSITVNNNNTQGLTPTVNCNAKTPPAGFPANSTTYDCNVILDLTGASDSSGGIYLRITPFYDIADVQIFGISSTNQAVNFAGTQALVDVTAKSGPAFKRLQAHVSINQGTDVNPVEDSMPEYAVRTSNTICKRLEVVNDQVKVRIENGSDLNCPYSFTGS